MRASIIGVIFLRELRDQLRDRRTIFMVVVLPLLLYPFLGMGVVHLALGFADKPSTVAIVGAEHLPGVRPLASSAWLTLAPMGPSLGLDKLAGAAAWGYVEFHRPSYPPLVIRDRLNDIYFDSEPDKRALQVHVLPADDPALLESKQVDLMLLVPADFVSQLDADGKPTLELRYREGDERGRTAAGRVYGVLRNYKKHLSEIRFLRKGLPADFDSPLHVKDAVRDKSADRIAAESIFDLLVRVFPFLLVMWSLAGALYPAVDVCAGEKERGTMETLLISPASREEIVWGKFLTIWLFSAASALLNLASMGITSSLFGGVLPQGTLPSMAFGWCALLALPLTAFFSAVCLAVGVYARSSKEGQYYLMPLFFVTLPLVFLTMAPGVELNPFYSMVPITGVALLMQRLMTSTLEKVPWVYFLPVLAPMALYSWLALRWAIEQFHREEVLFREAERLDLQLWVKRLLREKEVLPSVGQAAFCFFLMLMLRLSFFSTGSEGSLVVRTGISYLAFVAAPPMFMALMLTKWPRRSLGLMWPRGRCLFVAALLAGLVLPPLAFVTDALFRQFPAVKDLLSVESPVLAELRDLQSKPSAAWASFLLVFGVLAAVCEEVAFRGFILTGLRRRLGNWSAILFSSLLFALYHFNVFQAAPSLLLGVVLALLTVWSESVLPAMLMHLLHNCLLFGPGAWLLHHRPEDGWGIDASALPVVAAVFGLCAVGVLIWISRQTVPSQSSEGGAPS